jgi:tRNA(fMet)-specific endonuclease VapC
MLDTDTASYAIRERSPEVLDRLRRLPVEQTCVSAITHAELLYGVRRLSPFHHVQARVRMFLEEIPTLPWGVEAAGHYADIRFRLQQSGQLIGPLDMQIAAHAIAADAILVTNNARHFERVGPPLVLENWHR